LKGRFGDGTIYSYRDAAVDAAEDAAADCYILIGVLTQW